MNPSDFKKQGFGLSRRRFLGRTAAVAALTIVPRHVLGGAGQVAPSDKTTLACIGLGSQGTENLDAFLKFPEIQVVAVCDVNRESGGYLSWYWGQGKERRKAGREPARRTVDKHYGEHQRSGQYKGCAAYADYRELLAREDVDAVMIATPDHAHAVITLAALQKKRHVYCEKPLTWSVAEARRVSEAARQAGVATQMGNMGQAEESARRICEILWDGAIGSVREVQVWSPARFWRPSLYEERPKETPPVPDGLEWDLWLGPAPHRPYHPEYHPWTWRNWWDFGTGLLGDLGCHKLSTVFKALKLGHPVSIEACSTKINPETYPMGVIARYEFPARGDLAPVTLTWYDGGLRPPRPPEMLPDEPMRDIIYIGDRGKLMGERLVPESRMESYKQPPKTLPRSPGHYYEFVAACRGGPPAGSNFVDHAGLLSEVCLLGNVALRAQKKLAWDGPRMRITNDDNANKLLQREYRSGWTM
ncbi:MAG TPA: Gfo/Idh/MocA family oxidoreductase [Candidatus Paceibacterota bacterium]|nr:Gfo/Idh/MocA family oxidoreductase [Verrucomicrobiota bacterium]HRY48256.1 Gfo/Idh/MocA family oxidoreductase [Candidatus Paceibacterota bacterium]